METLQGAEQQHTKSIFNGAYLSLHQLFSPLECLLVMSISIFHCGTLNSLITSVYLPTNYKSVSEKKKILNACY